MLMQMRDFERGASVRLLQRLEGRNGNSLRDCMVYSFQEALIVAADSFAVETSGRILLPPIFVCRNEYS